MQRKYEKNNIFYKIINKEIPSNIYYEDENVICFHDINPKSPVHLLLLPKKEVVCFDDFVKNSTNEEVANFFKKAQEIAESLDVDGYRIVANCGEEAGQVVFHFHLHIMGYK